MKLLLKILLTVFIVFILVCTGAGFYLTRGLETGSSLEISSIDPSSLNDGIYNGKYNAGRWSNELSITIKDQKIIDIDVIKDVVFVKPEVREELFNGVIAKQSTHVDAVSQATVTCKAYLKSIEDALKQ